MNTMTNGSMVRMWKSDVVDETNYQKKYFILVSGIDLN